jgi:hypothetical protein
MGNLNCRQWVVLIVVAHDPHVPEKPHVAVAVIGIIDRPVECDQRIEHDQCPLQLVVRGLRRGGWFGVAFRRLGGRLLLTAGIHRRGLSRLMFVAGGGRRARETVSG